jgi:hypothetical protein
MYRYCCYHTALSAVPQDPYYCSVPTEPQDCPPDIEEIAEAYCMQRLDHSERMAFENHYLTCPRCASVVTSTDEYVGSMKAALRHVQSQEKTRKVRSGETKK